MSSQLHKSATDRDHVSQAIEIVRQRDRDSVWMQMERGKHTSAIYHELCRLDTGCQRTGVPADKLLPPCPASATFRFRRGCA